jgi:hypothetical protein
MVWPRDTHRQGRQRRPQQPEFDQLSFLFGFDRSVLGTSVRNAPRATIVFVYQIAERAMNIR